MTTALFERRGQSYGVTLVPYDRMALPARTESGLRRDRKEVSVTVRHVTSRFGIKVDAILPHDLPESVAGHRVDYWTWVENYADTTPLPGGTTSRDSLLMLRDHWRENNTRFFDGIMLKPYITLTEPSAPQIYGQCCPVSSWGSRLEIRIRPSLLDGTHPQMKLVMIPDPLHFDSVVCDDAATEAGRLQFVKDVLLHEMIHQHIMEHQRHVNEESYHGHGPVFTEHCNRIGAELGLAEVVVRNRKGKTENPKSAQWPHCVAPPERYLGVYQPPRKRVTATTVTLPPGYNVSAIAAVCESNSLEITFDTTSGDARPICMVIEIDTATELADFIMEYLAGDADEEQTAQ